MTIRIGINGMGRIGRCVVRAWLESGRDDVAIVAANDLADPELIAHLLRHDTTHGPLRNAVQLDGGKLRIDDHVLDLSAQPNAKALDWGGRGVDIVFESTGRFTDAAGMSQHLEAGAKKVLLSAPGKADIDRTVVYGINHTDLTSEDRLVSNASCTTNCLAPIAKVLHQAFGMSNGLMTTVHSFTNDQVLIDGPHKDPRRARAAGFSMIPTTTGAAAAVGLVLPELNGKLTGFSMRVPTINVSVVDLTARLEKSVSAADIDAAMRAASEGELKGVLGVNDEKLVSVDFNHNACSSVFDATQTLVSDDLVKVISWYDNEWGFSNRMLDVAAYWGAKFPG